MTTPSGRQSPAAIFANIWRESLLRHIMLLSVLVSCAFPIYNSSYLVPQYSQQFTATLEDEAQRSARYMQQNVFADGNLQISAEQLPAVDGMIRNARHALLLDKVKVFSRDGTTVYSTSPEDIGKLNHKDYFRRVVEQGVVFSHIVQKNRPTGEGRISERDVAEVYVPVQAPAGISGAFEIYYDVTDKKAALDQLVLSSTLLGSGGSLLLFALLVLGLYRASKASLRRRQAETELHNTNDHLAELVEQKTYELQVTQKTSIEALAILAESYDADTGAHLERIQRYVECLASALRHRSSYSNYLSDKPDYISDVTLASLLHDIGKTAIPRQILTKPGKLTVEEFAIVQTHTDIAGQIIGRANRDFVHNFGKDSYLAFARDIALHHHEKWDGSGYPQRLKGKEIPLSARIVALADVYDALRSKRPYKEPWPHEEAVAEIARCSGSQFDPEIVTLFLENSTLFSEISKAQVTLH